MGPSLLTNSSVGAANAANNPGASGASAHATSSAQGAAQVSQVAAQDRSRILGSEKSIAPEKRSESNFDTQENSPNSEGASRKAKKDREDGNSNLLAVA